MLQRPKMILGTAIAVTLLALSGANSADTPSPKTEPERYAGIIMVTNAPATGVVRVKLTIERVSTVEERKAYAETIKAKGSDGLAQAMEDVTVGYIQFDQNLRYPLAYALKVETEKGTLIRVATNRPINVREQMGASISKEYPIGIMELLLPKDGKPGEGFVLGAASVTINDKNQLEVKSLPQNTGPQKVSNVEREEVKSK